MLDDDTADTLYSTAVGNPPVESLRYHVLRRLRVVFPEEELFTCRLREINQIEELDELYEDDRKAPPLVREYLKEVYEWVRNNYGFELENLKNADFLYLHTFHSFPSPARPLKR